MDVLQKHIFYDFKKMNSNYSLADGVNSRSTVINFVKPVSKVEGHQLNHSDMIIF